MSKPKVFVLGCGPAGLISAYAAQREFNADVLIYSIKRKSNLFGCQYLHAPIPGLNEERDGRAVKYRLFGTVEEYREKVYGSLTLPVSPQQLPGDHMAWDIRSTYDQLWEMFEPSIINFSLRPADVVPLLSAFMPNVCISSVPLPNLCQMGDAHTFQSVKCWAIGDAPELGQHVPVGTAPFTVNCNGESGVGWYRVSNVFGYSTVEWPGHRKKPPYEGVVPFNKPLTTNCDCMPSVLRVGRFGRWAKGVLSHTAYDATVARIQAALNEQAVTQ
jgi:hypothetical protein